MCRETITKATIAANSAMSRQRFTLPSVIAACLGASLVSFYLGKLRRETAPFSALEPWMDHVPMPASAVSQKTQFAWHLSTEDRGHCPPEESEMHGVVDEDDDSGKVDTGGGNITDEEDDDKHENTRYHLTMSLRNVSHDLIESDQALFNLMQEIKDEFELQLIAHGCQIIPHESMIRCFGILSEGQISLYAWPEKSVLIFVLFSLDGEINIDDVKLLSRLFQQRYQEEEGDKLENSCPWMDSNFGTESSWTIRKRGDRDATTDYDDYMEDASDVKEAVRRKLII
jgi:hypothetical protein